MNLSNKEEKQIKKNKKAPSKNHHFVNNKQLPPKKDKVSITFD